MDSKKKKGIIWGTTISIIVVAILVVSIIIGVRVSQKKSTEPQPAGTVTISNSYNEAIATKKVSQNFNGTYEFVGLKGIDYSKYNPSNDVDLNSIIHDQLTKKKDALNNDFEKLVFFNGNYQKIMNRSESDPLSESGKYYGNDDLSVVITENGSFFISLNYSDTSNAINISENYNPNQTHIFVIETMCDAEGNPVCDITFIYELV